MFFPISTPICPYVPYVNASVPVGLAFRGGVRNRRGTTCLDGHCLRDHALATRQVRYPRFFLGKKTAFIVFFKEKSSKIRDESYFSQS
jgi:putative heme iron utilization protein